MTSHRPHTFYVCSIWTVFKLTGIIYCIFSSKDCFLKRWMFSWREVVYQEGERRVSWGCSSQEGCSLCCGQSCAWGSCEAPGGQRGHFSEETPPSTQTPHTPLHPAGRSILGLQQPGRTHSDGHYGHPDGQKGVKQEVKHVTADRKNKHMPTGQLINFSKRVNWAPEEVCSHQATTPPRSLWIPLRCFYPTGKRRQEIILQKDKTSSSKMCRWRRGTRNK